VNDCCQSRNRLIEPRSLVQSHRSMRFTKRFRAPGNIAFLILAVPFFLLFPHAPTAQESEDVPSTAWKDGHFHVDVAGVIRRSDIVLGRPNVEPGQALPLGNGRIGVAVWSANGLTAQLNRADTLPDRLSLGQVVIPGLAALTQATDYSGRLVLYDGEFQEQGGGINANAYVRPDTDTLAIEASGVNPDSSQTAQLKLWQPRTPQTLTRGRIGLLAQSWIDNKNPESSGRRFGSLSAITVDARDVVVAVSDPVTITVSFRPYADGHFRVLVAAPHFDGSGNPMALVQAALSVPPPTTHRAWWHAFWNRAAVIKIRSGSTWSISGIFTSSVQQPRKEASTRVLRRG
jgi:alpha-L-fucosidase 2